MSSKTTLSAAELTKLEHAFAADPSSDAYKPLAEAYLGLGRFMEAMVVCKKGIKAHATQAEPRLLLARVYAEQGKDKKALEEALGALQVQPEDRQALRMAGVLALKAGDAQAGRAHLLKAHGLDPADADTLALLAQHGVEVPPPPAAPAPVAAPPAVAAAPAVAPAPAAPAGRAGPPVLQAVPLAPEAPAAAPPPRPSAPRPAAAARVAVAPARRPVATWDEEAEEAPEERPAAARARRPLGKAVALLLAGVLLPALVGYKLYTDRAHERGRELKRHLVAATEELKRDSYASYKKATHAAEQALEIDPGSTAAHGYLAYVWAIRWGEHGGGDEARQQAEEHLTAARRGGGELSSHLIAAEALVQTYAGKGREALAGLERQVKALDAEGRASSLLNLTLGLIQMNSGDLERARESLEKAQALAPADPRVHAAAGAVFRRRGQERQAWQSYDLALSYEKDHPESLLGRVLLTLEQEAPNYELAAKMLKKLLETEVPPSPRQLAAAHLARALLVSRVQAEMAQLRPDEQARLAAATGVSSDKDKARDELRKAEETGFTLDKRNPELLLIKAQRLRREGQVEAAIIELHRAIELDPTRAQFHIELARALMRRPGGEKEAAESLTTALKTMGESPKLLVMLGDAQRRQGKAAEALEAYGRALKDPKARAPEARLGIGIVQREKGEWKAAVETLQKASEELLGEANRSLRAVALTELGRAWLGQGDTAKAEETFERALDTDESFGEAYFHYAQLLAREPRQGRKVRGLAQQYLKLEPRGSFVSEAQALLGD